MALLTDWIPAPPPPRRTSFVGMTGLWQGKKVGNSKKMFFRGNELGYVLQLKDLTFLRSENELVFERKRTPIEPQKGPKTHPSCGLEVKFASRKARAGVQGATSENALDWIPLLR
jgi:hypothetical protein